MLRLQQQHRCDSVWDMTFRKDKWKSKQMRITEMTKWLRKYHSEGFMLCILSTCIKKPGHEKYLSEKDGVRKNCSFTKCWNCCVFHFLFNNLGEDKKNEWAENWGYLPISYGTTSYKGVIAVECEEVHAEGALTARVFSCLCPVC